MNNLYLFMKFDINSFLEGKTLQFIESGPWNDFDTGKPLGTRVDVVITEDATPYKPLKDGTPRRSNRFEKFSVKVRGTVGPIAPDEVIELVNPRAKVWGDRQNQLSVEADDVRAVIPAAQPKAATKPPMPRG